VLDFLYTAISWILLRWHQLFSLVLDPNRGLTWALSIMFLVITIRVLLFRFFVKQVRTQRKMQELQPKIAALREKYKNDRQTLGREMLKLQQEAGVNPLGGCLPILLQAPVFLALFHVLRRLGPGKEALYGWSAEEMSSASNAKLFGAPISAAFRTPADTIESLDATVGNVRLVSGILVILMVVATYVTQRQIMARTSQQALDPQQAMIQKVMLYGIPASLLVSGFIFPVGVLCYWLTNNLWTMGQQFYILRKMPYTGAPAAPERPKVDPKLLAPKPGAKPVIPKGRRPGGPSTVAGSETAADSTGPSTAPPRGPSRPQPGKRPTGTRPKRKRR
jgi:YidC/Oxa1 family membrane protein insertase